MALRYVLFLDDGGVMNDNSLRGPQWQRLVAEFLAPRLGGSHRAWAEAHNIALERQVARYQEKIRPDSDFVAYWTQEEIDWLRDMCELVGVQAPDTEDECLRISCETSSFVTRQVQAAFPGVIEALRALHAQGHRLHAASGEASMDLEGYLEGMGARHLFGRLYGPDLVHTPKLGPLYYRRIFADAGSDPSEALVVDDSPGALRWANEAGARTVLVSPEGRSDEDALVIPSLAELPSALERMDGRSR